MGRRNRLIAALPLLILAIGGVGLAQEQDEIGIPPARPLPMMDAPRLSEAAQWVLRVTETGGFAGFNRTLMADSTDLLLCSGFPDTCGANLGEEALLRLDRAIANMTPGGWSGSLFPGSDMLLTRVVLVVRSSEGLAVQHEAYWNLSPTEPSTDAGELRDLLMNLVFPQ
jgi:hypothetical protein